jgi:hypothetical protein
MRPMLQASLSETTTAPKDPVSVVPQVSLLITHLSTDSINTTPKGHAEQAPSTVKELNAAQGIPRR